MFLINRVSSQRSHAPSSLHFMNSCYNQCVTCNTLPDLLIHGKTLNRINNLFLGLNGLSSDWHTSQSQCQHNTPNSCLPYKQTTHRMATTKKMLHCSTVCCGFILFLFLMLDISVQFHTLWSCDTPEWRNGRISTEKYKKKRNTTTTTTIV